MELKLKYCNYCGELLEKRNQKKYCSNLCQGRHKRQKATDAWLRGDDNGVKKGMITKRFVKAYIIERDGERCKKCGWCAVNKITGKVPIELDHIDGDSENCHPDNLRLLCPSCHSLTEYYGSLNKGNGRGIKKKKLEEILV